MSEMITRADSFIAQNAALVEPMFRPAYHCAPPIGWVNDPNGFSYWNGRYHLFGQFYPYEPVWGPMHWGHWVSDDMVSWQWVSTALAPDSPFDDKGCFSGTAVADGDRLVLMYTGVHADETGRTIQEQCVAVSTDGVHFEKLPCNPVIRAEHLPADGDPVDFRDPKLMRTKDGWRAIVANRGASGGRQLSFSSPDLVSWRCDGVFLEDIGDMPECPDYFDLDGRKAMITCVMNMPQDGLRFPSGSPVVYILGREQDGRLIPDALEAADNGIEFYAPETVRMPDGRQVMLGWLHMWGHESPTQYLGHRWCGMYTIPRELFVKDGRMHQRPLRELERLRCAELCAQCVRVDGETHIPGLEGRRYELALRLTAGGAPAEIRLLESGDERFTITYDPATRIITCDRSRCGYTMGKGGAPEAQPFSRAVVPGVGNALELRIFVDTCSVEVFAQDGAVALSTCCYPRGEARGISFAGDFAIDELRKWELGAQ